MTGPVLTTPRLRLVPVAASDFDDVKALWSDGDFTRAIAAREPLTVEEVWFRLLRDLGHWSALGIGNWSLRLTQTGAYVGSVGVLDYRRESLPRIDAPELGWGVAPRFQGAGPRAGGRRGGPGLVRRCAEGASYGLHDRSAQCAVPETGRSGRFPDA